MVKKARFLWYILTFFSLTSCASIYSKKDHYQDIDYYLESGNTQLAVDTLTNYKDSHYSKKDRVLFYLEQGMLYHYNGMYLESNQSLTMAEEAIEQLIVKSISKGIMSGLLNDNALEYPGEDYEDIYISIFKALNYMHLNSIESALVEVRSVNDKLTYLESKYSKEIADLNDAEGAEIPNADYLFFNDALARYMGTIAYRVEGSVDDARIERDYFERSYNEQPIVYNFSKPKSPELENQNTYINIIVLTGYSPEKVPETVIARNGFGGIHIEGDNSYIGFDSIGYSNLSNDFYLKFQFPTIVKRPDPVHSIEILVNGEPQGQLEVIESLENIALETFKVKQPLIIGKTIIRAVAKSIASEAAEKKVEKELGALAGLLTSVVGDIYMQVSENSDLRASRYFPSRVWGIELVTDPSIYDITIVYRDSNNSIIYKDEQIGKEIKNRGLNLIESHLVRIR